MIRKIIGWPPTILLSILLFVLIVALVFAGTLGSNLTDFSFIKQELKDVEAYSLAHQWLDDNMDEFVPGLEETELYQVFKDSLSEEWLAEQVDGALDTVSDYLDEETDTLEVTLSLAGFKTNLKTVLHDTIHESPPEGLQELSTLELDDYLEAAYTSIDELPGEITVTVNDAGKLEPLRQLPGAVSSIFSILLMVVFLLAIVIILLHLLLLGTGRRGGGLFAGIFMLLTGITCFIIKAVITGVSSGAINDLETDGDLPSPLTAEVVNRVIQDTFAPATTWAIIFTVVGAVLVVASVFLLRSKQTEQF